MCCFTGQLRHSVAESKFYSSLAFSGYFRQGSRKLVGLKMRQAAFFLPYFFAPVLLVVIGSISVCPDWCVTVSFSHLFQILLSSFP